MEKVLIILYWAVGYWAVNKVLYEGRVVIYSSYSALLIKKLSYALIFGWIFIPVAILKSVFFK